MPFIQNTTVTRQPETLDSVINRLDKLFLTTYTAVKGAVNGSYQMTYHNPDHTAQEVIAALCVKYQVTPEQIINIHSLLQDVLQAADPTYVRLVPPNANQVQ